MLLLAHDPQAHCPFCSLNLSSLFLPWGLGSCRSILVDIFASRSLRDKFSCHLYLSTNVPSVRIPWPPNLYQSPRTTTPPHPLSPLSGLIFTLILPEIFLFCFACPQLWECKLREGRILPVIYTAVNQAPKNTPGTLICSVNIWVN